MSFKFRKRPKIAPGVYLNLSGSKKGLTTSVSVGAPGLNVNLGKKKDGTVGTKRGTLSIPGSGIRYDESLDETSKASRAESNLEDESSTFNVYWWLSLGCLIGLVALHYFA